jgi:hypothetical protein
MRVRARDLIKYGLTFTEHHETETDSNGDFSIIVVYCILKDDETILEERCSYHKREKQISDFVKIAVRNIKLDQLLKKE